MIRITLEGKHTVSSMHETKQAFLTCLKNRQSIEVSFCDITKVDLSFFELLHTVQRSFAKHDLGLILLPDLPEAHSFAAAWSGFTGLCTKPSPATTRGNSA